METSNGNASTDTTTTAAPAVTLRFTKATRRGLADVLALVRGSFDDNAPPTPAVVSKWTKKRQRELDQALAWIAANSTPRQ